MMDWCAEVGFVFARSRKTQFALLFGVAFFVGILLLGRWSLDGFALHGPLEAMTEPVRDGLMHRYDSAAWAALGTFVLLAFRTYRADRRRLFGL